MKFSGIFVNLLSKNAYTSSQFKMFCTKHDITRSLRRYLLKGVSLILFSEVVVVVG